jgi:hypothetical protein
MEVGFSRFKGVNLNWIEINECAEGCNLIKEALIG